jgi:hypothetical protein
MTDISGPLASEIIAISVDIGNGINDVVAICDLLEGVADDQLRKKLIHAIGDLLAANFRLVESMVKRYPELDPDKDKDIVLDPELQKIIDKRKPQA